MRTRRLLPVAPSPAVTGGARAGFTVVEVIVAVMVLSIGILGLASTAAFVTRQMAGGAQMSLAASVAQARFERLRGADCTTISGGTATTRGIIEAWTVTPQTRAVLVTETVTYTTPREQRSRSYRTLIPCT